MLVKTQSVCYSLIHAELRQFQRKLAAAPGWIRFPSPAPSSTEVLSIFLIFGDYILHGHRHRDRKKTFRRARMWANSVAVRIANGEMKALELTGEDRRVAPHPPGIDQTELPNGIRQPLLVKPHQAGRGPLANASSAQQIFRPLPPRIRSAWTMPVPWAASPCGSRMQSIRGAQIVTRRCGSSPSFTTWQCQNGKRASSTASSVVNVRLRP